MPLLENLRVFTKKETYDAFTSVKVHPETERIRKKIPECSEGKEH